MLILHRDDFTSQPPVRSIVLVFGVGLIGSHVVEALLRRAYILYETIAYSWLNAQNHSFEFQKISEYIRGLTHHPAFEFSCRIDFLWSAGKGGFGMSENDMLDELLLFSDLLTFAQRLSVSLPNYPIRFHMTSSAGGLFEGQRNVKSNSIPCAKRPYAALKIQEEELLSSSKHLIKIIYRLSSVYGFSGLHNRLGLIPTLLWNGHTNKVSVIFGSPDTLRDYVWVQDIAEFIAGMIESKNNDSKKLILASGKPTSVQEISIHVQRFLNKQIFLRYVKDGGNSAHNTFSMETRTEGWIPSDLETGIRKTGLLLFISDIPHPTR